MILKTPGEICRLLQISNYRLKTIFKRKKFVKPKNVGTDLRPVYELDIPKFVEILSINDDIESKNVSRETFGKTGNDFIKYLEKEQSEV